MKRIGCRYAIVRFLPYAETQEFANVGIVLACPETGFFGFRLEIRHTKRFTDFFKELDARVYRHAIAGFELELERIAGVVARRRPSPDQMRSLFDALVHPREAIIRFGSARALLTEDPQQAVEKLFGHYVGRDFVTHDYKEQTLTKRVRGLLDGLDLPAPFREKEIGDDYVHAQFPLVQVADEKAVKAIKPFFLAQEEPIKILKHGGLWVEQVKFLRRRQLLPDAVMFAVEGPEPSEGMRFEAFEEICADLRGYDVQVAVAAHEQQIKAFATA